MKICFLSSRRFAYINQHLAYWLKKKYSIKDFSSYVYLRWSYDFLKSQKEVPFNSLLLDEEVHKEFEKEKLDLAYIASLEKEYGLPNLWAYVVLDRMMMFSQPMREYPYNTPLYSHEELMRILQVKARAIISFLEKEKPDVVFFSAIGGMGSLLLYRIARKMGITVLNILPTTTEQRYVLSGEYDRFTGVEDLCTSHKDKISPKAFEQAKKFLAEFRNKPQSYFYNAVTATAKMGRGGQLRFLLNPKQLWQSVSWYVKLITHYLEDRKYSDYSSSMNPWYYVVDRIKRKTRNLIGSEDLYDPFDPEEDFAFFPLHYEPEIATLLLAPFYTDQINLVRQAARALPMHFKLYVKEHPLMVDYRPRSFYKELKKNPNVKLIKPNISGLDIVAKAKLIITITSSAAWEGVMLKKPAISFGDWFYNFLPMVKRCRDVEQLPSLVKSQLEHHQHDEDALLLFLAAIFEDSISIDMVRIWEQEPDEAKKRVLLEPLADLLAKKMSLMEKSANR